MTGRSLKALREELERVYLLNLFQETKGNLKAMLDALGVEQATLYRWFKRLGIDPRALRRGL